MYSVGRQARRNVRRCAAMTGQLLQLALLLGFGAGLSYAGQVVILPPAPAESSL